jgi:hypothetical protein
VVGDDRLITLCFNGLPVSLKYCLATPGALDGLAAAGREEDAIQVARRVVGEPLGQLDRRRCRVGPQREEGQRLGLLGGRLGELLAAVADLDHEQA